jgi:RNA polymerase subunit RPABC4/transcription elongation factor Spt4
MFCANCGKQLQDSSNFCPYCGTKKGSSGQIAEPAIQNAAINPAPTQQPQTVIIQPVQIPNNKPKYIGSLRIMSIIGFVLFPFSFYAFFQASLVEQVVRNASTTFGFALAHAIVGLVQSIKHNIKSLKIMSVIGIIWSPISFIFIVTFSVEDYDAYIGWVFLGLAYSIAFAIVSIVKAASFRSDFNNSYNRRNYSYNKKCRLCATVFSGSVSICPKCGSSLYEEVKDTSSINSSKIQPITIDDSHVEKKKCRRCGTLVPADEFICIKCGGENFI